MSRKLDPDAQSTEADENMTTLKPKFHFLIHCATMMLRHGPVSPLSSMGFESTNILKGGLKNPSNNINTPFSAAKKEQYHVNYLLFENSLPSDSDEVGKWYPLDEPDLIELASALCLNPDPSILKSIKTVTTSDGLTFVPGYVVLLHLDDHDEPELVKITRLFLNIQTQDLYFKGDVLLTIMFSPHYEVRS